MAYTRIPFESMSWVDGQTPGERKKSWPDRSVTLLELAPGFSDPALCRNGHTAYVIEGALDIDFAGGRETFSAGEAFAIDIGTPHRAANTGSVPVRLFVVTEQYLNEGRT